ncbi:hypothetical protein GE09DRAFT_978375, partial [Coniochaeta sp. 2T2.1]
VVAPCGRRETGIRGRVQQTPSWPCPADPFVAVSSRPLSSPHRSDPVPDCIGDKRMTLQDRTCRYCRHNVRNDHFDDAHLEVREHAGDGMLFRLSNGVYL